MDAQYYGNTHGGALLLRGFREGFLEEVVSQLGPDKWKLTPRKRNSQSWVEEEAVPVKAGRKRVRGHLRNEKKRCVAATWHS